MTELLDIARQRILVPAGMADDDLNRVLDNTLGSSIDDADVYFQLQRHETWVMEDGIIKEGNYSIDQGVGIRAISGEKTGFAYSDEIVLPALMQASKAARAIARGGQQGKMQAWKASSGHDLYRLSDPIEALSTESKLQILKDADAEARRIDKRIQQVVVSLSGLHEIILVANSDGSLAADIRPLVRMNVSVIVEDKGRREQGSAGGGGRFTYEHFIENNAGLDYARKAVSQALLNLEAVDAPAGNMNIVLGPGWPGVLLHEAVGHGLEGDFNRKGSSAFSGRIGEKVASEHCTVIDDGTLKERRGSLNIDDEGTRTQQTVLIEKGILKGYMQDRLNAKLTGVTSTGNGRRESFSHLPMPRMTNTYMLAGQYDPGEIIASVENGLYAVNFAGGQVDITSGKFVFSTSEAYLIENGKVTRPVKGATLIGNGPDVMTRVSMVGNDLKLDDGVGTCGKEGQNVPVGVGQPTMRIDGITVGGTGI